MMSELCHTLVLVSFTAVILSDLGATCGSSDHYIPQCDTCSMFQGSVQGHCLEGLVVWQLVPALKLPEEWEICKPSYLFVRFIPRQRALGS